MHSISSAAKSGLVPRACYQVNPIFPCQCRSSNTSPSYETHLFSNLNLGSFSLLIGRLFWVGMSRPSPIPSSSAPKKSFCPRRQLSALLLTHQRRFVTKTPLLLLPSDHRRLSNTLFNHLPQSRLFMMNNLSHRVPRSEDFVCMVDWRLEDSISKGKANVFPVSHGFYGFQPISRSS